MANRVSAGLVMYRVRAGALEVFLAHPGGPFFVKKDHGHWTIPKGEVEEGEDRLDTALREFKEEVGIEISRHAEFIELGSIRQKGGKTVYAWGVEQDCPESYQCKSNLYKVEWPPKSGKWKEFPEVDRAQFFEVAEAKLRVKETQVPLLERLELKLAAS